MDHFLIGMYVIFVLIFMKFIVTAYFGLRTFIVGLTPICHFTPHYVHHKYNSVDCVVIG